MKKLGFCFLLLVFLGGCAEEPNEIQRGMELRSKVLQAEQWCFDADITADYGDKLHQFSLSCRVEGDGDMEFQITAPETISGITGEIDSEGGKLTFDDTALYFELLTDDQLSPISAPWVLVKALRSGYLTSACQEEDGLRLTIDDSYEDDALTLDIWLNEQELPKRCEILYDGSRILTLDVKNVVIG